MLAAERRLQVRVALLTIAMVEAERATRRDMPAW